MSVDLLEPMNFDAPKIDEVPITIGENKYVLRKGTADIAKRYRAAVLYRASDKSDGKKESLADLPLLLLSMTLHGFVKDKEGNVTDQVGGTLPIDAMKNWPNDLVKKLYDRSLRLSDLTDEFRTLEELKEMRDDLDKRIKAKEVTQGEKDAELGKE